MTILGIIFRLTLFIYKLSLSEASEVVAQVMNETEMNELTVPK